MIYQRGSIKLFFRKDPTLKGYWPLNGNSVDYSENGFNGLDSGVVYKTYVGLNGWTIQAAYFNGSAYITPTNIFSSTTSAPFSVGCWSRFFGFTSNTEQRAFNGNRYTADKGFDFSLYNNSGVPQFEVSVGNGSAWIVDFGTVNIPSSLWNSISSGNWFFVVVVVTSTSTTLYVNGFPLYQWTYGATTPVWGASNLQGVIGAIRGYDNNIYARYRGVISEFFLFNRALSPAEISDYYKWAIGTRNKSVFVVDAPSTIYTRRRLLLSTY
jgi:hypothetical protein